MRIKTGATVQTPDF